MRKMLLIGAAALLLPTTVLAQTGPTLSEGVPTPREEQTVDGYRLAAISVGAVAGVIVANALTGGMIMPVLMAGGEAGMAGMAGQATAVAAPAAEAVVASGAYYTTMAAQAVVTVGGAVIGGYVGNWLYGN